MNPFRSGTSGILFIAASMLMAVCLDACATVGGNASTQAAQQPASSQRPTQSQPATDDDGVIGTVGNLVGQVITFPLRGF
jgi:hypothetical protein